MNKSLEAHQVLPHVARAFHDLGCGPSLTLIEKDLRVDGGHALRSVIDKLNMISYSEGEAPRTSYSVVAQKQGAEYVAHVIALTPLAKLKIAVVRYEE